MGLFMSVLALVQALGICCLAIANPLPDEDHGILARQNSFIAITGIRDNGVQPRLEIRQLASNAVQWNLYLIAMQEFQTRVQNNPRSYYQISGKSFSSSLIG